MVRLEQCDPIVCASVRDQACQLFELKPSRFTDRSQKFVNIGIAGDSGRYYSVRHDACPAALLAELSRLAPRLANHELDQAYINVYPVGASSPRIARTRVKVIWQWLWCHYRVTSNRACLGLMNKNASFTLSMSSARR